jgi:hypothetical protein
MRIASVLLLLIAAVSQAQQDVKFPRPEEKGVRGRQLTLSADTSAKVVKWYYPASGFDVGTCGATAFVTPHASAKPGRYKFTAIVAIGPDQLADASVEVVIDDADPVIPPVEDTLLKELRALYGVPDSAKAATCTTLSTIYNAASNLAKNPAVISTGQLNEAVAALAKDKLDGQMMPFRLRVKQEIVKLLGEDDAALTDELRAKIASVYARMAALVLECTKPQL